jgi:hypothetical protein
MIKPLEINALIIMLCGKNILMFLLLYSASL